MSRLLVGVNGFGRIGRLATRAAFERGEVGRFRAVVDMMPPESLAQVLRFDSNHGNFPGHVKTTEGAILVGKDYVFIDGAPNQFRPVDHTIAVMPGQKSPADLSWRKFKSEGDKLVVIESTGLFTDAAVARKHLEAGADWVIISAPATNPDFTVVVGVNDRALDFDRHVVVSNASCTTNCLAPVADVLQREFGIRNGRMVTIHSYTADQPLQDAPHRKEPRRSFAAGLSMVPTTTGAARAVGLVLPELVGKLDGYAMRVPTPNVSVVDLVLNLVKNATVKDINDALKRASEGIPKVLGYTEDDVASVVFAHDPRSSIVDAKMTTVADGNLAHVLAWYDNEWGFSNRLVDLIEKLARYVERS